MSREQDWSDLEARIGDTVEWIEGGKRWFSVVVDRGAGRYYKVDGRGPYVEADRCLVWKRAEES